MLRRRLVGDTAVRVSCRPDLRYQNHSHNQDCCHHHDRCHLSAAVAAVAVAAAAAAAAADAAATAAAAAAAAATTTTITTTITIDTAVLLQVSLENPEDVHRRDSAEAGRLRRLEAEKIVEEREGDAS